MHSGFLLGDFDFEVLPDFVVVEKRLVQFLFVAFVDFFECVDVGLQQGHFVLVIRAQGFDVGVDELRHFHFEGLQRFQVIPLECLHSRSEILVGFGLQLQLRFHRLLELHVFVVQSPNLVGLAVEQILEMVDFVPQLGDVSLIEVQNVLDFLLVDLSEFGFLPREVVGLSHFGSGDFGQQFLFLPFQVLQLDTVHFLVVGHPSTNCADFVVFLA